MPMTPKRQALFDAMKAKIGDGWEHIPDHLGFCIRWDRVQDFPDWVREMSGLHGDHPYRNWDPTYTQSVFLTIPTPSSNPLLSVHRAPWVNGQTIDLTLKRAFGILADPASVLDRS